VSLRLRLLLGPPSSLIAQILTVSSLVALISGALSLSNLLGTISCGTECPRYGALVSALSSEFGSLFHAWLIPVWAVLAVSMYLVSLNSARTLRGTMSTIASIGGQERRLAGLFLTRHIILSTVGLLLGMSLGLVVAQVGMRMAAIFTSAPYEIPVLMPFDVLTLSLLVYGAAILGCLAPLVKISRSGPLGGVQR
jgi:ABC-type lipoprotein release transport system permease subunit